MKLVKSIKDFLLKRKSIRVTYSGLFSEAFKEGLQEAFREMGYHINNKDKM